MVQRKVTEPTSRFDTCADCEHHRGEHPDGACEVTVFVLGREYQCVCKRFIVGKLAEAENE